jgi:HTH-type transcriptional repressor of NAD biosynthesis genes
MSTRGLVLGKFAPFHRGHEALVRRALAETDETVVLVYDAPEATGIPTSVRAGWIRALYPQARVLEGIGAPTESGRDPRIQRLQEAYVRSVVPGPVTHFYSSEWYGAHMSRALGAVDVRVDEARDAIPARGTAIRRDPAAHRHLVDPLVFLDLLHKVVLVGGESTGKSTLCAALAAHYGTNWMREYGRDYWLAHRDAQGLLTPSQLVALAEGHRAGEVEAARSARRLLFVDTDARTTRQYARRYHGHVPERLDALADACAERYDLTVLCGDEIPYEEDGTRAGADVRAAAQAEIRTELERAGAPWLEVTGSVKARVAQVTRAVAATRLDRYRS